ncbi:MAG TPA: lysophospholipid acyltransferase family protein [Gemmatimonadaceae bacterium]
MTHEREHKKERRIRWAARLGPVVVRALARTWRIDAINQQSFQQRRQAHQPVIFAFWHSHMLPLVWQHRDEGVAVLISQHADGEIIARICEALGYRTVRGSTSRGGARALVEMDRQLQQGIDVAITPDGPRGPAHSVAPGVVYVAQRASVPIVPIDVRASRAWHLRTWDRFMIPKPFARITIRYGNLHRVPNVDADVSIEGEAERLGVVLHELASA